MNTWNQHMVFIKLPSHSERSPNLKQGKSYDHWWKFFKIQKDCSLELNVKLIAMFWQEGRKPLCTTIVGYVSDSQTDLQSPVQFALSYSLVQVTVFTLQCIVFLITATLFIDEQEEPLVEYNTGKLLPLANSRPILNQQQVRVPSCSRWVWWFWWWWW